MGEGRNADIRGAKRNLASLAEPQVRAAGVPGDLRCSRGLSFLGAAGLELYGESAESDRTGQCRWPLRARKRPFQPAEPVPRARALSCPEWKRRSRHVGLP